MYATCVSILIATAARTPAGATNAYLVAGDGDTLLIDPVTRTDRLDDLVARGGVDHLAIAHTHVDHVGAVVAYARETDATVWCRRGHEYVFSTATGVGPNRTFAERTTVPVGAGVEMFDMPGYAHDHASFVTGDDVFYGDLAVAEDSVVVGAPEGDVRAYLVALRRLHVCGPERLHPGHGPEITDPRATLARLAAYRNDHERAVLGAVHAGNATPDVVTDAAYDKDVSTAHDLARTTVVAHVEKLAVERRVRWDLEAERVEPR